MEWERHLAEAGCRITEPRRAIVEVFEGANGPLLPREILVRGRLTHPALGLVTVYRTLDLLTELQLLRRVHREDGCHGYLIASPGHHHVVICQVCGEAVEFAGEDDIRELIQRVERETSLQH